MTHAEDGHPGRIHGLPREQQDVLDAIGYGEDVPEMEDATRDALMSAVPIEKSGDTYRMPSAVHKAWFVTMAASESEDDDGGEE